MEYIIKNRCACCDKEYKNSKELYETRGNYCFDCMIKINAVLLYRAKLTHIRKNKKLLERLEEGTKKYNSISKLLKKQKKQAKDIEKKLVELGIDAKKEAENSIKFEKLLGRYIEG